MIELAKYFRILFLSVRISRVRLKEFTEDHIIRLTNNNPGGIFTTILTAVTNAYTNYYGDMSSEEINLAVQEGKTIAMNESREALEKQLSENEKLVAYTYRNNLSLYEEFYPLGLTEYQNADLGTFDTITQRYKSVLSNHSADFPVQFVTDYNTVQGTFKANRDAQITAFSDVSTERSDLQTTRPELAYHLTKNLLTIALQYLGDESKAEVYFNQAILNAAFNESATHVEDVLDPGATANVFDNITKPTVSLTIKNTGFVPFVIGFASADNIPVANDPERTIGPGEEIGASAGEAGWTTQNKYLNITNYSGGVASYDIEKT